MQDALLTIAQAMERRAYKAGSLTALKERKDLEPEFVVGLSPLFPERVEKDRKFEIPGWQGVGNVDIVVRRESDSGLALAIELKWGGDKLEETLWDLFKMALLATREDVEAACLAAGAPFTTWERSPCSDLFESGTLSPLELCSRRYLTGSRRLIWDYMLEGGWGRSPNAVPREVRTARAGRATMKSGSEAWELRFVRILPIDTEMIEFHDGWPSGVRPPDARYPTLSSETP